MTSMLLVTLLLAAQGAAAPIPPEVIERRTAAMGFALTSGIFVERMALACAAVPDAAPRFAEASQAWTIRNKPYTDAALGWMEHVTALIAADQGAGAAQAFASRTFGAVTEQVSEMTAQMLPGSPPLSADCLEWADLLDTRGFDMGQDGGEFSGGLRDIRAFIESAGERRAP